MSQAPIVELYDAYATIAGAVTKAYRLGRPYARKLDHSHARLLRRHGIHGICHADDPDLMFCGQAIRDLTEYDRTETRRRLYDALQQLDRMPYIGDLLRART